MKSRSLGAAARLVALVASLVPSSIRAQDSSPIAQNYTVEASLGPGYGIGLPGPLMRKGTALDFALSKRLRRLRGGMLVVGGAFGAQARLSQECRVQPDGTGCPPDFPSLIYASLFAGIERRHPSGASIRATLGPATVRNSTSDARLFALHPRIDLTTATRHVGVLVSLRGLFAPNNQGHALFATALGFGIRVE